MEIEDVTLEKEIVLTRGDALIVIDMQNDFLPGGALPVSNGNEIIPGINDLIDKFNMMDLPIIFTQDWHPKNHLSFASQHDGKEPYDLIEDPDNKIGPVLWPDHCVQGTRGAMIHDALHVEKAALIIRKGYHEDIDSYSAFLENDKKTKTGLAGFLKEIGVGRIFTCGLALDYCVYNTVIDARMLGFNVVNVLDLTRAVGSPEGIISKALNHMVSEKVAFTKLENVKT
ncbi:MAG: bifunctional nicotinamidase/pyrazinamidase [Promethearchaeota archaeon]